jgi:hypothetical protein
MDIVKFYPIREGGIRNLALGSNICVEHADAHSGNALVQQELILVSKECGINHFDGSRGSPLRVHTCGTGVHGYYKRSAFTQKVGGGVHYKARPTMDGALWAE